MDYTSSVAGWMQLYTPEYATTNGTTTTAHNNNNDDNNNRAIHYLSGPYKVFEWNPTLIEECLSCMTPDNMLLMISSPFFDDNQDGDDTSPPQPPQDHQDDKDDKEIVEDGAVVPDKKNNNSTKKESNSAPFDVEKWYGTKYRTIPCDEETWSQWRSVEY